MPGFDGTGPHGLGPFTGRGQGFCVAEISQLPGQSTPLLSQPLPRYGRNFGLRRGFISGRGRGFGRGRGRWFY